MNYSNIIENMTWSYSRINSFFTCPYQFYLKYVLSSRSQKQFFSDYGSFMHKILEKHLLGDLSKEEAIQYYCDNYNTEIQGIAPNKKISSNYFRQGYRYLENMNFDNETLAVEHEVRFKLADKYEFVGIIDRVSRTKDGTILVDDHKSKTLSPRSMKKQSSLKNKELDEYLRQLYLYSIPVAEEFGQPKYLRFNCFRTQTWITEPFKTEDFLRTQEWAILAIQTIISNEDWSPDMEYWKCKYICDQHENCDYYLMNER